MSKQNKSGKGTKRGWIHSRTKDGKVRSHNKSFTQAQVGSVNLDAFHLGDGDWGLGISSNKSDGVTKMVLPSKVAAVREVKELYKRSEHELLSDEDLMNEDEDD